MGDTVLAVGSPLGVEGTVTSTISSATGRSPTVASESAASGGGSSSSTGQSGSIVVGFGIPLATSLSVAGQLDRGL